MDSANYEGRTGGVYDFKYALVSLRKEMRRQEGEAVTLYRRETESGCPILIQERWQILRAYPWHVLLWNGWYRTSYTYYDLYRLLRKLPGEEVWPHTWNIRREGYVKWVK